MTIKLPDDQTLWFRNLPPATSDEKSRVEYHKSKIGPGPIDWFSHPDTNN